IITHAGMNLDVRLKEFKLFENDDQRFWEGVIGGEDPVPPSNVTSGEARMRLSEQAFANYEIVDSLIEEEFTSAEDEDIIRELEEKLELLGLDPSGARDMVLSKKSERKISTAAQPFQVLPQREWEQLRKGLSNNVNRAANLLVNRLGISRAGRELVNKGIPAQNNFVACVTLINKEIKKTNPKDRKEWTSEEFKSAHEEVENIINKLTKTWKGILNEKT
ncbi:MAG: hypothetical protein KAS32_08705, partial [Candidatus Peribacteraceae bacterium]|nr:hypothetical protein [Candidatus Peribacteraceae bacterium]